MNKDIKFWEQILEEIIEKVNKETKNKNNKEDNENDEVDEKQNSCTSLLSTVQNLCNAINKSVDNDDVASTEAYSDALLKVSAAIEKLYK